MKLPIYRLLRNHAGGPACCRENDAVPDHGRDLVTRPPVPTVLAGRLKRRLISPAIRLPSWSAPTRAKSSLPLVRLN